MTIETKSYSRRYSRCEAVQITADNINELAERYGFVLDQEEIAGLYGPKPNLGVMQQPGGVGPVHIKRAFIGDWIVHEGIRTRAYTRTEFEREFLPTSEIAEFQHLHDPTVHMRNTKIRSLVGDELAKKIIDLI